MSSAAQISPLTWLLTALGMGAAPTPAAAQSFFDKLIDLVAAPAPTDEPRREPVPSLKSFSRTLSLIHI